MLRPRIIPVLLYDDKKLVKTIQFTKKTYLGDPINAVKIFNEKEVDELIFLDITQNQNHNKPNYNYIKEIASECFIPFGYGGGIDNIEKAKKILYLGAEKIIINSHSLNFELINQLINDIGGQSVVISMDIKKNIFGKRYVYTNYGKNNTRIEPIDFAIKMEEIGVGEILINNIDYDGTYKGYDLDLIKHISDSVKIPTVALGGANSLRNLVDGIKMGASGVAAGSLFVYYGPKKAVLINYPDYSELEKLY